jgi:hypothetical protein
MPRKPDHYKILDSDRRDLLKMPGNALKIWLFYWMKEGGERLAWDTEKDICAAVGLNKNTMHTWRDWLEDNGWLKRMGYAPRKHGEFPVPKFRADEGQIPGAN